MRVVGVVTVARSDYGILRPLISRIVQDGDLDLHLLVSGMHLSPEHGMTVRDIEEDGFLIADRFPMPLVQDTPEGIGQAIASGIAGFAGSFNRARPDIMVVLGDRYEMLAAVIAA
ncbi:MAG: UDP-N-acetylglucosamine 2-epimerase, partial [bacterium]